MKHFLVVAACAISLLGVLPSTAQTDVTPRLEAAACPVTITTERAIECGVLLAPLDKDEETAGDVRLPVAVLSGGIGVGSRPPVLLLSGTGGQSSFDSINTLDLDVLAGRDVILMEQRGGRYAEPIIDCPEIDNALSVVLSEPLTFDVEQLRLYEVIEACHQWLMGASIDLSLFSIAAQAADVSALMELLGYERYSLYGVSLGVMLAQLVAHEQPERVESVVLDSPLFSESGASSRAQATFESLVSACSADTVCNNAYPDLARTFYELVDQLEGTPFEIDITAGDGTMRRVVLTGHRLIHAVVHEMSQTNNVGTVPLLISTAANGDYSRAVDALSAAWQAAATTNIVSLYSALCTGIDTTDAPAQSNAATIWESVSVSPIFASGLCGRWNSTVPLSATESVVAKPTLVLTGAYDPLASPAGAETTGEQTSLVLPARSRNLLWSGDDCADAIAVAFLELPSAAPDASCAQDATLVFAVRSVVISTPAAAQTHSGNGFTTVVPEGWSALAPGVFGSPNADLLLFMRLNGVSVANAAEVFLSRTRVEPDDVGDITIDQQIAGSYTWTVTQLTFPAQDLIAMIAATEAGGVSYLVILQSPAAQFEVVRETVWLPALEAFAITG